MGLSDEKLRFGSDALNLAFTGVAGPTGIKADTGPMSKRSGNVFGPHANDTRQYFASGQYCSTITLHITNNISSSRLIIKDT